MNKEFLKNQFEIAKENKNDICIELEMPNQETTEKIINNYEALDNKLNYYLNAYNENLELYSNSQIKIINVYSCDWYDIKR